MICIWRGRRFSNISTGQHSKASGLAFWQGLEAEVEQRFKPASMHRVYKENTWAPAPKADVEKLIEETDYVLVGLGA